MSSYNSSEGDVVIVGAGYGGVALATLLKGKRNFKLISPEEFFFHNAGAPRACVEPGFAKKIMVPLREAFGDAVMQGKVVEINKDDSAVVLEDGNEVNYSELVLATGTSGPFPFRLCTDHPKVALEHAYGHYEKIIAEIEKAKTIVCIGGGAVGVELSGEIKTDYPTKDVTLIHSNQILCTSRLKASAQSKLQARVRSKGINLMLGEKVTNLSELTLTEYVVGGQILKTESGTTMKADLIFKCTGARPATDCFKHALGDSINEKSLVKVDQYFKVIGHENIYAIGDITDIDEEKMVVTAEAHSAVLAKNLEAISKGKKMKPYKPAQFLMVVPVGRDAGVSQLFGIVLGDFVTRNVKGKGLFVKKIWGNLNVTPPQ